MRNNHILPFLWMRGESEEILREEMQKIDECGIGAVCLEARPHEEFCKEGWWHDVDIIMDEARKRDMKIWILDDKHFPTGYANGLIDEKYPERKKWYINRSVANITGYPNRKMTLNVGRMVKPAIGYWEIEGFFAKMGPRMGNRFMAMVAVRMGEGGKLCEEMIDLTDTVKEDGFATFTLPAGNWSVYVLFRTQTDGGNESYINMIDKVSAATQIEGVYESHWNHYKEEFGKTILGFFSDEPQFGNIMEVCYDAKLGKAKMPLPWSDELEDILKGIYGDEYVKYLPFLFQESAGKTLQHQIRYDYMNAVSRLYQKNFCEPIGQWCQDHGVEYIGHVVEDNGCHSRLGMGAAHFFRAIAGQHMAGVDIIGEQVVLGAPAQKRQGLGELGGDGEFHHYTLAKLGASAGHLDPKKKNRTLCELFGAYGWNFGVRDMKYVLDHLLVRGINELVPHAFSMKDYPDEDCPPHFYARGNNGQFPAFAKLMKYANRMCETLSGGVHVPDVAVLYDGEADWVGGNMMPMQKVDRVLMENQIEFDIVPADYLKGLTGDKLVINGLEFGALFIPYTEVISAELCEFLKNKGNMAVYFVGGYPESVIRGTQEDLEAVKAACGCVELAEIPAAVEAKGLRPVKLSDAFSQITYYHYQKDAEIFMFQNESANDTFRGSVKLPVDKVVYYNGLKDRYEEPVYTADGEVILELAPIESVILMAADKECTAVHTSFTDQLAGLAARDISANWKVSLINPKEYPVSFETMEMPELVEVSESHPTFSGIIRYEKSVTLDAVPAKAILKLEQVYEVAHVFVNGEDAGYILTPPYQIEIGSYLKTGENEIKVEVLTTPARDQLIRDIPPFDFSYEAMEATGMVGAIELYL